MTRVLPSNCAAPTLKPNPGQSAIGSACTALCVRNAGAQLQPIKLHFHLAIRIIANLVRTPEILDRLPCHANQLTSQHPSVAMTKSIASAVAVSI